MRQMHKTMVMGQDPVTDAVVICNTVVDGELLKDLLYGQMVVEAMWLDQIAVLVFRGKPDPESCVRLYGRVWLLKAAAYDIIDLAEQFLMNRRMYLFNEADDPFKMALITGKDFVKLAEKEKVVVVMVGEDADSE